MTAADLVAETRTRTGAAAEALLEQSPVKRPAQRPRGMGQRSVASAFEAAEAITDTTLPVVDTSATDMAASHTTFVVTHCTMSTLPA